MHQMVSGAFDIAKSSVLSFLALGEYVNTDIRVEGDIDSIHHSSARETNELKRLYPGGIQPLFYRKVGNGPDVFVLIHGMVATSTFWVENMLSNLTNVDRRRCTFILPDLAGYGKSLTDPVGSYSVEEQVDLLIRDVLIPEGVHFFHLIGHSYGGLLALHLAGRIPEQILTLNLLAPAYFSDASSFTRFLVESNASSVIRWIGRLDTSPYALFFVNCMKPLFITAAAFVPDSVLPFAVWRDIFETRAYTTIMTIMGIRATGDLLMNKVMLKSLKEHKIFMTVFHGDEDWVVPLCHSQQLVEDYPFSRLVVIRGVGHQFPVTTARNTFHLIMKEYTRDAILD